MNDSPDKHAPTDDFVEYLARDTMRRLRYEGRFAPSASEAPSRSRRLPAGFGIAAGVVMTLATGMVLGASANYASAEVLPNGITTIPSRPPLAILPIRNALTAIGCTQTTHPVASEAKATAAGVPRQDTAAGQVAVSQVPAYPDRARIAALATQHRPSVVRGDTAAEYVVMVLDAAHHYVWSTSGNGNVSIEVGGDQRTPAERREYDRAHQAEFWGKDVLSSFVFTDSAGRPVDAYTWSYRSNFRKHGDSTASDSVLAALRLTGVERRVRQDQGGRGGIGRANSQDQQGKTMGVLTFPPDSLVLREFARGYISELHGVRQGRLSETAADTVPGIYTNGWSRSRNVLGNQAEGLHRGRFGDSGILGLTSANVSGADVFTFGPGELAPRALKIMVVHLTPGTTWSGR